MLYSLTSEWLQGQLTHHVSLSAANFFWKLAFKYVFHIHELKANEGITRGIPQFLHQRRVMYKNICPEVKMSFAFLNKEDGSIIVVKEDHTPLSQYQRDPNYQKLYEEAHIEVSLVIWILNLKIC